MMATLNRTMAQTLVGIRKGKRRDERVAHVTLPAWLADSQRRR